MSGRTPADTARSGALKTSRRIFAQRPEAGGPAGTHGLLVTAARAGAFLAVMFGAAALAFRFLPRAILPGLEGMFAVEPNAAMALLLAGVALWGRASPDAGRAWRILAFVCSLLMAVIGVLTLVEHAASADLGIDALLVVGAPLRGESSLRMGLNMTIIVVSLGVSLTLLSWPLGNQIAQFLTLTGFTISALSALRAIPALSELPALASFSPIPVSMGVALGALSLGLFGEHQRRILHWIELDRQRIRREIEKAASEELVRLSSQFKAEFLVNMNHEFRTPLNGVLGMMEGLSDTALDATQKELVETARVSAHKLLETLQNIMSYWEGQSGALTFEPAEFEVREIVAATVKALGPAAQRKGLEIAYFIAEDVPPVVNGDRHLTQGALMLLLSNAVKFTEKGEVVVNVSRVSTKGGGLQLTFSVTDSGIGISPDMETRLFQPFAHEGSTYTRRHGGIGLGLVVAKRMVEVMGGIIGYQSSVGQGSTFWYTVSFQAVPGAKAVPTGLENRRVLVVAGEAAGAGRNILNLQLAAWRMEVERVSSAAEAFAALSDAVNRGRAFSLLLLGDEIPPAQREGLARKIRQYPFLAGIRTVLLRARSGAASAAGPDRGVDAVITSPIQPHELESVLKALLALSKKPAKLSPEVLAHARLLVAEDDKVNQKVAILMLKRLGLKADLAEDGAAAVRKFRETHYDLVLMDCNMPEMDGYEATREIRRLGGRARQVPIIALTANTLKGDQKKCLDAGMDSYLSKPINPEDLHQTLIKWLRPEAFQDRTAPSASAEAVSIGKPAPEGGIPTGNPSSASAAPAPMQEAAASVVAPAAAEAAPEPTALPAAPAPVREAAASVVEPAAAGAAPEPTALPATPAPVPEAAASVVEPAAAEAAPEPAVLAVEPAIAEPAVLPVSSVAASEPGPRPVSRSSESVPAASAEYLDVEFQAVLATRVWRGPYPQEWGQLAQTFAAAPVPAHVPAPAARVPQPTPLSATPSAVPSSSPAPVPASAPSRPQEQRGESLEGVIDPAAIANLRELGGGEEIVIEAVGAFVNEESMNLLFSIGSAIQHRDPDALRRAAHTLKGASNAVGAKRLGELCRRMEEMGAGGVVNGAESLFGDASRERERACQALRRYLP